ncbi:MAG: hypothetical protein WA450_16040, partial [Candidatus Acidiferrales bacterium]
ISGVKLDKSAGPIRRALQYAFYDWASEMPRSKRIITYVGVVLQGYAFYFMLTQLETDQIAARQIQQTLQPGKLEELPGYEVETSYQPFRDVGGDYFDVIELPAQQTFLCVSGCVWEGNSSGPARGQYSGPGQKHRKCGIKPAGIG